MVRKLVRAIRNFLVGNRHLETYIKNVHNHLCSLEKATEDRLKSLREISDTFFSDNHFTKLETSGGISQIEKRLQRIEQRLQTLTLVANFSLPHFSSSNLPSQSFSSQSFSSEMHKKRAFEIKERNHEFLSPFIETLLESVQTPEKYSLEIEQILLKNSLNKSTPIDSARILDLSFLASFSPVFAKNCHHYVAFHNSPTLVEFARNAFQDRKNMHFYQFSEENIQGLEEKSFDFIVALFKSHHWSTNMVERYIGLTHSLLKKDGRFILGLPISNEDIIELNWPLSQLLEKLGLKEMTIHANAYPRISSDLGIGSFISIQHSNVLATKHSQDFQEQPARAGNDRG